MRYRTNRDQLWSKLRWYPVREGRWVLWCTNPPDPIESFDKVLEAAMKGPGILGVELKNPGHGVSIDDIISEQSYAKQQ